MHSTALVLTVLSSCHHLCNFIVLSLQLRGHNFNVRLLILTHCSTVLDELVEMSQK